MFARRLRSAVTAPRCFLAVAIVGAALATAGPGAAQAPATDAAGAASKPALDRLVGAWTRPDGGYTIVIKEVRPDGSIEATYYNPRPLPFAAARATTAGGQTRLFFELRAGGYGGSTYDLAYDPLRDVLTGAYRQAVAGQTYSVTFARRP